MAYKQILYDVSEGLATITLNRPEKLNAWTGTMEEEIRQAMYAAEDDDDVRVIILTGAGRGFCAGADMGGLSSTAGSTETPSLEESRARMKEDTPRRDDIRPDFTEKYSYFPSIQKPIIAAINGAAAGLGFVMSLYCDLRFASDKAKFTTAFSRRGLIAEHGISWTLQRIVGLPNALDLTLSARVIMADEAFRMGLVNQVYPANTFEENVKAYATELANYVSPRSTRIIKEQLYNAQFQSLQEAILIANDEMFSSLRCDDFKEGVAHFVEKRSPAFTGK
ncbi:MAG: enoyl-CoA hydratase [Candidatus Hydrogenedentota bacterium]